MCEQKFGPIMLVNAVVPVHVAMARAFGSLHSPDSLP